MASAKPLVGSSPTMLLSVQDHTMDLPSSAHVTCAGDDPNYWIAATRSAEAEYMKKKVRKLLAEINNVHEPKKVSCVLRCSVGRLRN